MRRILLLALAGALLVAMSAGTAVAKGSGSGKGSSKGQSKRPDTVTYVFEGKLIPDPENGGSYALDVTGGKNKVAREAMKSGPLSFAVITEATATQDETKVELNGQEAKLADLQVGDEVVIQAKGMTKDDTSFTARVISAERPEAPTEPTESAPADSEPSS